MDPLILSGFVARDTGLQYIKFLPVSLFTYYMERTFERSGLVDNRIEYLFIFARKSI